MNGQTDEKEDISVLVVVVVVIGHFDKTHHIEEMPVLTGVR